MWRSCGDASAPSMSSKTSRTTPLRPDVREEGWARSVISPTPTPADPLPELVACPPPNSLRTAVFASTRRRSGHHPKRHPPATAIRTALTAGRPLEGRAILAIGRALRAVGSDRDKAVGAEGVNPGLQALARQRARHRHHVRLGHAGMDEPLRQGVLK